MEGTHPQYCEECGSSRAVHYFAWVENAFDALLPTAPPRFIPRAAGTALTAALQSVLRGLGLLRYRDDFAFAELPRRTALFAEAARQRGICVAVAKGPWGYTNQIRMRVNDRMFSVEGLPNADRLNGRLADYADDKWAVKKILMRNGFPVAAGRSFGIWNRQRAMRYGRKLGFPLVVKPRHGSVARHVTINIRSEQELRDALRHAFAYGLAVIVEQYIPGLVHRLTVVDDRVFCVRQLPAHVTGDGKQNIRSLVAEKNARPERHVHPGGSSFYSPLTLDDAAMRVLRSQDCVPESVPAAGVRVWLADDPFMRNGGDLEEVTAALHPDNRELALRVAKLFGMKLVSMDVILEDAAHSWKEQSAAVLELNSLPSIEMHHWPSYGTPQDVAGAIADMTLRYYT